MQIFAHRMLICALKIFISAYKILIFVHKTLTFLSTKDILLPVKKLCKQNVDKTLIYGHKILIISHKIQERWPQNTFFANKKAITC